MTRDELATRAATRGYSLHDDVTDERLARVHPRMLRERAAYLDVAREIAAGWISDGCLIAPYALGEPGDEVIALPITDDDCMTIVLPSYHVVATCTGQGETNDGGDVTPCEMQYTILR